MIFTFSKSAFTFYLFLYQLISIFYIYMQHFLISGCVAGSVGFSIEKERLLGRRCLFLDFKVFVCWIFISVDLHIGYVSLFGCHWNGNGLEGGGGGTKLTVLIIELSKSFQCKLNLPDQLRRSLGRVVNEMHGTWQRQRQRTRLPSMRHQRTPKWSRRFVLHGHLVRRFDDELKNSAGENKLAWKSAGGGMRSTTYSFTVTEVVSASMAQLWLGFLMGYGGCDFFYSALNGGVIDSW